MRVHVDVFTMTYNYNRLSSFVLDSAVYLRPVYVLPPSSLATPAMQQSIDIACPPGPQQQTRSSGNVAVSPCWDRQTDKRTPYRYIDPALHMRVVPKYVGSTHCKLK